MKHTNLLTAIKGMIVGGTMLVPGVSGGSMAMILGIYTKLIHSVSSFTNIKKKTFSSLQPFLQAADSVWFSLPVRCSG